MLGIFNVWNFSFHTYFILTVFFLSWSLRIYHTSSSFYSGSRKMELGIFRPFFNANIPKPWQKTFWNLSYDNVDTLERIWIFSQKTAVIFICLWWWCDAMVLEINSGISQLVKIWKKCHPWITCNGTFSQDLVVEFFSNLPTTHSKYIFLISRWVIICCCYYIKVVRGRVLLLYGI